MQVAAYWGRDNLALNLASVARAKINRAQAECCATPRYVQVQYEHLPSMTARDAASLGGLSWKTSFVNLTGHLPAITPEI